MTTHREKRVQAGTKLRAVLLTWLEDHLELSDVEAATILYAQAHSLADQFLHAKVLEEDANRTNETDE